MPPPAASAIVATMLSNCTLPRRQPHVERRGVGAGNAAIDYRWPDQHIDYYFDERTWLEPSKKRAARRTVEIAVDELKHKVAQYGGIALTFTELASPGTHALNITAEDACSATVGYNAGPNLNIMNIGQCYTNEAFVKHELGHAVGGLWHEQQHPFASRYMHKGCDDTNDCDENCDQKGPFVATTTPYDPTSIMHYGLGACGGMVLNSVGLALAQALNIHPMAVGAAVNYSIHDAQMVAREYSDERLKDGNGADCQAQQLVPKCSDPSECNYLSKLADGTCDEDLKCYYLDGGDCEANAPLQNPNHHPYPHTHHVSAHDRADTIGVLEVILLVSGALLIAALCAFVLPSLV